MKTICINSNSAPKRETNQNKNFKEKKKISLPSEAKRHTKTATATITTTKSYVLHAMNTEYGVKDKQRAVNHLNFTFTLAIITRPV
jgi:hypothetical protein